MHPTYLVLTLTAAAATGYAAALNFLGAGSVAAVADRLHISRSRMIPFGTLLALGSVGLVCGLLAPWLGNLVAACLVVYFVCAVGAHVRARDRGVGGAG